MADVTTAKILTQQTAAAFAVSQQALTLVEGRTIDAKVQQILSDTLVRLLTAEGPVDVATNADLAIGARLRLQVLNTAGDLSLNLVSSEGAAVPLAAAARLSTSSASPQVAVLSNGAGAIAAPQAGALLAQGASAAPGALAQAAAEGVVLDISPRVAAPPNPASSQPAAPTLASVLSNVTTQSLTQQGPLAPLFANIAALLARPRDVPEALRAPLTRAGNAPLQLDDGINPAQLVEAIANSGVFLENSLSGGNQQTNPALDIKAILTGLRLALARNLPNLEQAGGASVTAQAEAGDSADAPNPASAHERTDQPAPPRRGDLPEALAPAVADLAADASPAEIANRLLEQTDAALSRIHLSQIASRHPESAGLNPQQQPSLQTSYYVEIPVRLQQQTTTLQVAVEREANPNAVDGVAPTYRLWFSLDSEPSGPVSAVIVWQPGAQEGGVSATLWAERAETGRALRDGLGELRQDLREANLPVGEITARLGKPQRPARTNAHFVDRTT